MVANCHMMGKYGSSWICHACTCEAFIVLRVGYSSYVGFRICWITSVYISNYCKTGQARQCNTSILLKK